MESSVLRVIPKENRDEFDFASSFLTIVTAFADIYGLTEAEIENVTSIKHLKAWQEYRKDPQIQTSHTYNGYTLEISIITGNEKKPYEVISFERDHDGNSIKIIKHTIPYITLPSDASNNELFTVLSHVTDQDVRVYGLMLELLDDSRQVWDTLKMWLPPGVSKETLFKGSNVKFDGHHSITIKNGEIDHVYNIRCREGDSKKPSYYLRCTKNQDGSVSIYKIGKTIG